MKISLNWLKKYVEIPAEISDEELIRLIGARLVEVEGVIDETHKYDNIYVVRVEGAEHIPDTHLTLCQINVGSDELMQVVCGAPNVREGMLAAWIAPGAVVPASVHEDVPFVIGKRKMRGYESNGMLAGADELDFGDDHSGIVEINPEMAKPGDLLADVFLLNDLVLEIENKSLTHRPDCFGIIGFAREVAGILGQKFESKTIFEGITRNLSDSSHCLQCTPSITLDNNVCSRYSVVVLEKHGELRKKYLTLEDTLLSKSGMKPISPIVDATNYLMLLTGQPLHAFDCDKFVAVGKTTKPEIKVRLAKKNERIVLLDDTEIDLNENDIVICSGDKPVALAGAMGGKTTMIDESTRNIIIESATFSLYNLRKTQMAHGIFSEAITRFTKGQPAYQTMQVAEACAEMLSDGFRLAGVADEYPKKPEKIVVKIAAEEINSLLGTSYDGDVIARTLENVGFFVAPSFGDDVAFSRRHEESAHYSSAVTTGNLPRKTTSKSYMSIQVPEWRTDIHFKEDIIEEVGRLLGYDNIEPTLPLHRTAEKNPMWNLKHELRNLMMRLGANEVLTYGFVSERLIRMSNQDVKNSYKIVNSISPDLQYVRQSIVPSLLEKAYVNEKLPVEKFAIYEMNKVYRKEWGFDSEKVPVEKNAIGFIVAERKNQNVAFYKAKKYVARLLEEFGIVPDFVSLNNKNAETNLFEPKRSAGIWLDDKYLGVVGEFKNSVRSEFKLAPYLAGFELDLDLVLLKATRNNQIDLTKKVHEDVTITTSKDYAETLREVKKKYPEAVIRPGTIYQAEGQTTKNMTFHVERQDD